LNTKNNIALVYKILALGLVAFMLLPAAVKASHIFAHQHHTVCYENYDTHFHTLDLDCEFYKFQLNKNYFVENLEPTEVVDNTNYASPIDFYKSLYKNRSLKLCYLRGPPALV